MSSVPISYTSSTLIDLAERTENEAWLLEAVYDIANQPLAVSPGDGLIYPPDGSTPELHIYASACTIIGDWRRKFLEVGTPLVLVTSFKLLDMMLEWVLVQNGTASTFRFNHKIAALAGPVVFPPLIESRPWLRERLIALYKEIVPLRGTIIHDRHFQATGGTLDVSSSRGGTIGPVVTFSPDDLRNFAVVLVSLLRYLECTWTMDLFQEKRIRRALDELVHLHRLPSLGQLPPGFLTVRVYVPDEDPIEIDVESIRSDIATYRSGQDILFEVRVIAVARDGQSASAFLVGWDQLRSAGPRLQKTRGDLANSTVPVPADIDPMAAARDLGLLPSESTAGPQT